MFNGMFGSTIDMWVYVGIIAIVIILIILVIANEFDLLSKIQENFSMMRESKDIWDFNPLTLIFGGIFILIFFLLDVVKDWFIKYKHQIIMSMVHLCMLVPLGLNIIGVIQQLPEFYFPVFIMYLITTMLIFVSRADDRKYRRENPQDHRYDSYHNTRYPNQNNAYGYQKPAYVKPKPKGLTKEQVTKKKKKIREKLLKNEELKNKYSLEDV